MTTTAFDRLTYVDKLKAAGIDDPTARAHADALEQALREEVATKRDIADVKQEIVAVKHQIEVAFRDVTIRLGSMIIVATGVLLAAKYFG